MGKKPKRGLCTSRATNGMGQIEQPAQFGCSDKRGNVRHDGLLAECDGPITPPAKLTCLSVLCSREVA